MNDAKLLNEYKMQIRRLEERVKELTAELYGLDGGRRNDLYIRIALLNGEIDDLWDSIHMMKGYGGIYGD